MAKILLVEDDKELACLLVDYLADEGHVPESVYNGADGLARLAHTDYDVIILDWALPDLSGLDICKQFREAGGQTPVIMLTGKREIDDVQTGLESGADDYLTKPFSMRELSARLRALLRRCPAVARTVLAAGPVTLNPLSRQVLLNDQPISLHPKEFAVLEFFMRNPNLPFSLDEILDRVWSSECDTAPDTVRIHIMRVRKKIDLDEGRPMIRTLHRIGYMLVPPPVESGDAGGYAA